MAQPLIQHRAQRVINDNGSLTTATFASTENGSYSAYAGTQNRFRVRSQLDEVNNKNNVDSFVWQARIRTSTTAAYGAWGALSTGGTYLHVTPSTNVANATQITTQRLSNAPSGTFAGVLFFCGGSTTVTADWNFTSDQYTEGECCLAWTTAATEGYGAQVRLWPTGYGTTATNYNLVTLESFGSTVVPTNTVTRTVDIDSVLKRLGVLRTGSADAALQVSADRTADADAALSAHTQLTADVAAAVRAVLAAQAQADAALRMTVDRTAALDASLSLPLTTYTVTTDLDAAAAAVRQAQAALDSAVSVLRTRTAGLDAQINAAGVVTVLANADAALRRLALAQAALDAAVAVVRTRTAGADARITATATAGTVQADFDAALRKLLYAVAGTDAALKATAAVTALVSARIYDASLVSAATPGRTLAAYARPTDKVKPHRRLLEVR